MYLYNILYGARAIRLIFHFSNSLFIRSFIIRKNILQLFLSWPQKIDLSIIPEVLILFIMSQNSTNPRCVPLTRELVSAMLLIYFFRRRKTIPNELIPLLHQKLWRHMVDHRLEHLWLGRHLWRLWRRNMCKRVTLMLINIGLPSWMQEDRL